MPVKILPVRTLFLRTFLLRTIPLRTKPVKTLSERVIPGKFFLFLMLTLLSLTASSKTLEKRAVCTWDPVGKNGKGVKALEDKLIAAGSNNIECSLYPGARHELLNEINRDAVSDRLISWLNQNL